MFSSTTYHGRRRGWRGELAPLGGPLADGTSVRIEANDLIPFELFENYKRVPLDDDLGYWIEDQGSRLDLKCGSRCVRWSYPLYLYNSNNQFSASVKNVSVCPVGNGYEVTSVDDGWILLGEKGVAVGKTSSGQSSRQSSRQSLETTPSMEKSHTKPGSTRR